MKVSNAKPKVVIISGAGLSADSGIRTYRGADGLYNGMRAEEVMNHRTMVKSPEIIHRFCDDRRVELGNVIPNAAHHMIKRLADLLGNQVIHLTQNIDDLMERAGHQDTFHLHGELRVMRSLGSPQIEADIGFTRYWDGDPSLMAEAGFKFRCPETNTLFRPAVVLFGEQAPLYVTLHRVLRSLNKNDILIIIGTQGVVLGVESFAKHAPCFSILNNLHDSSDIDQALFDRYLKMPASQAAPIIEEIVLERIKPLKRSTLLTAIQGKLASFR
jgi:NAD-dependent deacetylase